MGYILLSPEYTKSENKENQSKSKENQIENWHLFETEEKYYGKDDFLYTPYGDNIEDERDCITIAEGLDIIISKNSQCNNSEIFSDTTDLEEKYINSFTIGYRLEGIRGQYLNEFIKDYIKKHDKYNNEEYIFKKPYNIYYTNKNRTFFYSNDADTIRIIACMLRRCVCGSCIATLYGDNKK